MSTATFKLDYPNAPQDIEWISTPPSYAIQGEDGKRIKRTRYVWSLPFTPKAVCNVDGWIKYIF